MVEQRQNSDPSQADNRPKNLLEALAVAVYSATDKEEARTVSLAIEAAQTGPEALAASYKMIESWHTNSFKWGVEEDRWKKRKSGELTETFVNTVLGDDRITKEDLARFIAQQSFNASYGTAVKRNRGDAIGAGENPFACR